jgi:hypothetical protein
MCVLNYLFHGRLASSKFSSLVPDRPKYLLFPERRTYVFLSFHMPLVTDLYASVSFFTPV